ncbi:MAG: hypothetical protein SCK28_14090, partial [Bacillota bacterium]|nr:hypothetical protein [Bacillota bacterium]
IKELIKNLSIEERELIFSFFGIGGKAKKKQLDIAREFNLSQGRISKKIKNIIEDIQKELF